ncbi:hypothetical protein CPB84DRAFT_1849198 [Gymnopilus junonius]|uniref:F-box domain-containing protein n=1 Tax=Gymnopilus junonius TaxID=109634 RepID=A0A9P5NKZ6_GYMJU|nr:hypothetical protein CPB84DRAFT_1849198 [Gymnopilus junonius]
MASVRPSIRLGWAFPAPFFADLAKTSPLPLSEMKQSAFADLPAELLFSIFDHSESEDLINVAQSCRRLNLMALPIIMERAGFPEPEKIYVVKLARRVHCDELAPLILKISLNTMDKFSCVLFEKRSRALVGQFEDPASQISDFTHNIRRVNRLISRLSSIGSVTLSLLRRVARGLLGVMLFNPSQMRFWT